MKFPFFKPKPVPQPVPQTPLDENARKFVERVLELCRQGKLQWSQLPPTELHPNQQTGYVAHYKTLKIVVIPETHATLLELRNNIGVAYARRIRPKEIQDAIQTAVWEHSIAKQFLDEFLAETETGTTTN